MKINNKLLYLFLPFLIWNCTGTPSYIIPSFKPKIVDYQIDIGQTFYGWTDVYGYTYIPNSEWSKSVDVVYNEIHYSLGISKDNKIEYIGTRDKNFSINGYHIGDEVIITNTILGWGNYCRISEDWYAACLNENREKGNIQWFFRFDFKE